MRRARNANLAVPNGALAGSCSGGQSFCLSTAGDTQSWRSVVSARSAQCVGAEPSSASVMFGRTALLLPLLSLSEYFPLAAIIRSRAQLRLAEDQKLQECIVDTQASSSKDGASPGYWFLHCCWRNTGENLDPIKRWSLTQPIQLPQNTNDFLTLTIKTFKRWIPLWPSLTSSVAEALVVSNRLQLQWALLRSCPHPIPSGRTIR